MAVAASALLRERQLERYPEKIFQLVSSTGLPDIHPAQFSEAGFIVSGERDE